MDPMGFKEVSELPKASTNSEVKIKAFETDKEGINPTKELHTINEELKNKKYPGTEVTYKNHSFVHNGERVEGVFPKFESAFETRLPRSLYNASDLQQFKYCVQKLAGQIENNPELKQQFSERQLEQIRNGEPRISGFTWHHNEIPGKMQLVNAEIHDTCRHTGGRSIWGGGNEYR